MNEVARERDLEALTLGAGLRLDELVDREALDELAQSFRKVFGLSVRIFSADGALAGDASADLAICKYVNTVPEGRLACADTVASVKRVALATDGCAGQGCFTGAAYYVVSVEYDKRPLGRLVIGPYMPLDVTTPPASLGQAAPGLEPGETAQLFARVPRAHPATVHKLGEQLRTTLELLIFAGHKALLTSQMHLAAVRESHHELQEKNRHLQAAVDRMRELDRLKSNFLATVSHELRTPLTSIIGYTEMLSEGLAGPLNEEQREFLTTIRDKGEQLLRLIVDLLDLSKPEARNDGLTTEPVRLDRVLDDLRVTLTPAARKNEITLAVEAVPGLPEQLADPEKLRRAFLNIAENALKFTPPGGHVTITARALATGPGEGEDPSEGFVLWSGAPEQVEVRIADTGVGIAPSERDRIFDAFYQVDSSSTRRFGGAGLGLSIVKRFIDAHGGEVRVEANSPRGSVFIVTLPVRSP